MRHQAKKLLFYGVFIYVAGSNDAFLSLPTRSSALAPPTRTLYTSLLPTELSDDPRRNSYALTIEEMKPVLRLGKDQKIVNAFGLWCAVASLMTFPLWMAAMGVVDLLNKSNPEWDPNRAIFDATGKVWSKVWLRLCFSYPTISGHTDCLARQGACLYVANHSSWLDIPIICTVLSPVFKFIAKGELSQLPGIGQQLAGVSHVQMDQTIFFLGVASLLTH
jgi:hypothetical protein